jgi:hypothetical protein
MKGRRPRGALLTEQNDAVGRRCLSAEALALVLVDEDDCDTDAEDAIELNAAGEPIQRLQRPGGAGGPIGGGQARVTSGGESVAG